MTTQIIKPIPESRDKTEALSTPEHRSPSSILMSVGDFHGDITHRPQKVIPPSDPEVIQVSGREKQPQTT